MPIGDLPEIEARIIVILKNLPYSKGRIFGNLLFNVIAFGEWVLKIYLDD